MTAKLYAPEEYWRLEESYKKVICNGAGPRDFGWLVPDTLWGLSITEAANIHDYMYHVGKTDEDKKAADRTFLNNMLRLIDAGSSWRWLRKRRRARAFFYFQMVYKYGGPAFWADKNNHKNMGEE